MHWTKDISLRFEPLRELSRYWPDDAPRRVMTEGTPKLYEGEYDNWNGGTTYYTLAIYVPVHVYAPIQSEPEAVESWILEAIRKLQRQDTNDFVDKVLVQPMTAAGGRVVPSQETGFWLPGHFRLFISHLSTDKRSATHLKVALHRYGISSFVAHEDIEPTKVWQEEIEKALFSMDALAAILSPGFKHSNWTDQEVGVALGRSVLVLPIRYGQDPYGLIGKFQGIQGIDKKVGEVTQSVFDTLLHNPQTRARLVSCLVEQFLVSGSTELALSKVNLLFGAEEIPREHLDKIREKTSNSETLAGHKDSLERVNHLLSKHGAEPVSPKTETRGLPDDGIPF